MYPQPKHFIMAATSIQTLFKQQVTEEFKREFNIVWKVSYRKCTISHKNNPDDCTACLCPGCVQQYVYTLTLLDGGKVQMVDDIEGSLNRVQAGMAAGNGNATQLVGVTNMTNKVMQKVSRIENQLMIHLNNMRLQSHDNTQQSNVSLPIASVLPVAAVVAVPETQTMVRDEISDTQRAKLKALKTLCDDGVLSFEEYQQIKKDTFASSSNPTAPPQAQVVNDDDGNSSSNNENRSIADEITKLKELHSTGVLSDEEFQQAKKSALASFSK